MARCCPGHIDFLTRKRFCRPWPTSLRTKLNWSEIIVKCFFKSHCPSRASSASAIEKQIFTILQLVKSLVEHTIVLFQWQPPRAQCKHKVMSGFSLHVPQYDVHSSESEKCLFTPFRGHGLTKNFDKQRRLSPPWKTPAACCKNPPLAFFPAFPQK